MLNIEKYKQTLLDEFYLDEGFNVRRVKNSSRNGIKFKKGDLAQSHKTNHGYWQIKVPFIRAWVQRSHLILLLHLGSLLTPEQQIDHIDGNRENDHPDNLRIVTAYLNARNRKKQSNNTSGITGVHWDNTYQRYVVAKTIGKKRLRRVAKTLEQASLILEELNSMTTEYTNRHGK